MSGATVLSARDLRVELKSRRDSFLLTADSLDLCAREALVILGPNGSGKSTLMRTLAGLEKPASGSVACVATGPVTMVFQRPAPLAGSVAHNVRVVFLGKKRPRNESEDRVSEALARFQIDHLAEHRAATLSGGELRRLALARAALSLELWSLGKFSRNRVVRLRLVLCPREVVSERLPRRCGHRRREG